MSNPKDDDVITSAEDQPNELIEEQLDHVEGGLGYQLKNVQVTAYDVNGAGASPFTGGTIIAAGGEDALSRDLAGGDNMLRKRPGRLKMTDVKM